jgi:hypothetical protein
MKGHMLRVAASAVERVQHALRADVIERVDNYQRIALAVRMCREPGGDSVTRALIVRLVRIIMFFGQIMVQQNDCVISLRQPGHSLPDLTRHIHLMPGKLLPEPGTTRLVILDNQNSLGHKVEQEPGASRKVCNLFFYWLLAPDYWLLFLFLQFFQRALEFFESLARLAVLAFPGQALVFVKLLRGAID